MIELETVGLKGSYFKGTVPTENRLFYLFGQQNPPWFPKSMGIRGSTTWFHSYDRTYMIVSICWKIELWVIPLSCQYSFCNVHDIQYFAFPFHINFFFSDPIYQFHLFIECQLQVFCKVILRKPDILAVNLYLLFFQIQNRAPYKDGCSIPSNYWKQHRKRNNIIGCVRLSRILSTFGLHPNPRPDRGITNKI